MMCVGTNFASAASFSINSATYSGVTTDSANLNGSIDPNGTIVNAWFQDGAGNTVAGCEYNGISANSSLPPCNLTGLNPDTTYDYFLFADNGIDMLSRQLTFTTDQVTMVTITSASATGVSTTSATLNGKINPNGSTVDAWFQNGNADTVSGCEVNGLTGTSAISLPPCSLTGLTSGTHYTYTLYATDGINMVSQNISFTTSSNGNNNGNNNGSNGGGSSSSSHLPSVTTKSATDVAGSTATLNGLLDLNGYVGTAWFEYGTSSSLSTYNHTDHLPYNSSSSNISFDQTIDDLTPNTTYYFRAAGSNSYGTDKGSILSFKTSDSITDGVVTTVQATNKTPTFARLNAIFINQDGTTAHGHFEYGKTSAMTSTTNSVSLGTNYSVNFSDSIVNLTPNTIYYFRAVVEQGNVTYKGKILVFQTLKTWEAPNETTNPTTTTTTPVVEEPVVTGPVVTENQSSVINITSSIQDVSVNDEIEYLVTFKNGSSQNFENTKVTVQLPKEVDFKGTNYGEEGDDNIVTFDVGTLVPSQVGSMEIKAKINSKASTQKVLVTTAMISYNEAGSTQEKNELSYVTNKVTKTAGGLEANSIFGVSFLPSTLLGWSILILVALLLAFIARKIYIRYAFRRVGNADHIDNLPM